MLRRAFLLALVVALAAPTAAAAHVQAARAPAATPPVPAFFVSGRGWGHGVGMSQWGAYGFATRGTPYTRIVAHYYRGTTLGRAPVARVRVLLGEGRKTATITSAAPFSVRDGTGVVHELEGHAYGFGPGLRLKVVGAEKAEPLPPPVVFQPGSSPLQYGGKAYRGQIQVNVGSNRLQLVNVVGLEAYLYGVVPREVPFSWPTEALKAQAVVARSYALAVRKTGAFDLYPDTRSQVYGGIAAEKPSTNAAVDATAGQVLLYAGKVATTFFFSTSGGRTASIEDAWTRGAPIPYLVSVPDPYDAASPHHSWGPFSFTAAKLASTFRVPGGLVDVRVAVNPSQRVETVTFVGRRGDVVVNGDAVRTTLGLRSTWFRIGVLSLARPPAPIEYGGATRLTGVARGGGNVTLEQRVSGRLWEPAARVTPAPNGTVSVAVKPLASTDYRLALSSTLFGPPVRVNVAPRVRLQPATEPTTLRGIVRPVLPRALVQVQRLVGTAWRAVASARLDSAGRFEAQVELVPGTYRARAAPGRGFVPGYSPPLRVLR